MWKIHMNTTLWQYSYTEHLEVAEHSAFEQNTSSKHANYMLWSIWLGPRWPTNSITINIILKIEKQTRDSSQFLQDVRCI